jgi:hypothetical protein
LIQDFIGFYAYLPMSLLVGAESIRAVGCQEAVVSQKDVADFAQTI